VHAQIQRAFGDGVVLIDTAEAVARQVARRLGEGAQQHEGGARRVRLQTTGDPAKLARLAAHWLHFPCDVAHAPGV
jgi:glutamate racemase